MDRKFPAIILCLLFLFSFAWNGLAQQAEATALPARENASSAPGEPSATPIIRVNIEKVMPSSAPEATPAETPDFVTLLLSVAKEEIGYTEKNGYTKYGEWSGDSYAQWCAEFLCWCVNQVDQRYGTNLLKVQYPLYSGTNVGRDWFIAHGRYVDRRGYLTDWGTQWLTSKMTPMCRNEYVPAPGDWVFFTWLGGKDTDHVAMVEYTSVNLNGQMEVHVIEGNNPSKVARNTYLLNDARILGYGTVTDLAGFTMRYGNRGEKVRQLQEKLQELSLLKKEDVDGIFGGNTAEAIRSIQATMDNKHVNGIADLRTQLEIESALEKMRDSNLSNWLVTGE